MSVKGDTVPVSYHGSTYVCAEYEPSVRDAEPYDEDVDYFKLKYMKRIFFVTILMTFLTSTCLGLISIFSMDDITEFEIIYDDLMERYVYIFCIILNDAIIVIDWENVRCWLEACFGHKRFE